MATRPQAVIRALVISASRVGGRALLAAVAVGFAGEATGAAGPIDDRVATLQKGDAPARSKAARALGRIGTGAKGAVPALSKALADEDGSVRIQAALALTKVDPAQWKTALPVLLAARNGPDEALRAEAAAAWGGIGPGVRDAIPYLQDVLKGNDPQARQKTVATFARFGPEAVPALVDALGLEHSPLFTPAGSVITSPYMGMGMGSRLGNLNRNMVSRGNRLGANTRYRTFAVEALREVWPGHHSDAGRGGEGRECVGTRGGVAVPRQTRSARGSGRAHAHRRDPGSGRLGALPGARGPRGCRQGLARSRRGASRDARPQGHGVPPRRGDRPRTGGSQAGPGRALLGPRLDDPDGFVRFKAAEAMAQADPSNDAALDVILELLESRDNNLQSMATASLEARGPHVERALPRLRRMLKGEDAFLRLVAARVLTRFGPAEAEEVIPVLRETLEDDDIPVRMAAVEMLWDAGHRSEVIPILIASLGNRTEPGMNNQASQILQRVGPNDKEAIAALVTALRDGNPTARPPIIGLLSRLGSSARDAVPVLVALLQEKNTNVAAQALSALSQMGPLPDSVLPKLIELLKEPDVNRRGQAINLVGQMGDRAKPAIPALTALLKSPQAYVRNQAVSALRQVGAHDPEAVTAGLLEALRDKDPSVRANAAMNLSQIGADPDRVVTVASAMLKDPLLATRLQGVQMLATVRSKTKATGPALAVALRDKDQAVRSGAVQALNGSDRSTLESLAPTLEEAMKTADSAIRLDALRVASAGARVGSEGLVAVLVKALNDSNASVRLLAVQGLGGSAASRDKAAAPALVGRLSDTDTGVRLQAARALIGGGFGVDTFRTAVPVILDSLKDPESKIRSQAAQLLSMLGPQAEEAVPALKAALNDPEPSVRFQVALALIETGRDGAKAAWPILLEALQAGSNTDRLRVLTTLRLMGDAETKAALPILVSLLKDPDLGTRNQAVQALLNLGPQQLKGALPDLVEVARDADSKCPCPGPPGSRAGGSGGAEGRD